MEIITTHINADFDALAAMMAAHKLYPHAKPVFPGSQEKNVRNFIAQHRLDFARAKEIPLEEIDRIIVVDNKNPGRLGPLSEAALRPGMRIHLFDHHPHAPGDLQGEMEIIEEVGATTTLLVERLRDQAIPLSPFEATLFALGIYEETGSLTFPSTTPRDLRAAAFLIEKGADLKLLSGYLVHELDADQIALLNELIHNAKSYYIDGIKVVIAKGSSDSYISELSTITHKVRDMENLDVLFVLVRMEDKLQLVARSRLPEVDVGEVAREFGGGGHATAAAAAIRDLTSIQAEEKILHDLQSRIKPLKTARDIMNSPVKTAAASVTIRETSDLMTKYGVSVLPVLEEDRFVGLVTRELIQKAIFHQLGESPVTDFMSTEFQQVGPGTSFRDVEALMIEHNQRFMPVVERGALLGAITRTDLLRALHEDVMHPVVTSAEGIQPVFQRNLKGLIHDRLPPRIDRVLQMVGKTADEMGISAYAVGGFVRDLLMGIPNLDVDVVIEGDGIAFAQEFGRTVKARVKTHPRFGTAVVIFQDGFKVDIATARTEFYEYPTALPTVEHASIKKDLYRRDFTINTLAVRLNKKEFGALIDHFGGQRDIKEKTIRVLHNLSFVEDPTRVYRAIRFEQRFGFRIAKHTQTLIKSAVTMDLFHRLSGHRVYDELVQLLSEEEPVKALRRLSEFDLLRFIHPSLSLDERGLGRFDRIREALSWYDLSFLQGRPETWVLYLMGFLDGLSATALQEVFDRLAVPDRLRPILQMTKKEVPQVLAEIPQDLKPSRTYALLHPLPVEVLLFMMAKAPSDRARKPISLYLTRLREVRTHLTGKDLEQMGVPRGPLYAKLLQGLLDGRLNGEIASREDEVKFVTPHLQKTGRGPKPPQDPQRDTARSSKETGGGRPPEAEPKEPSLEKPEIGTPVREPREKKPEDAAGPSEPSGAPAERKTSGEPTEQKSGSGRRRRRNRGRRRRGRGKPTP